MFFSPSTLTSWSHVFIRAPPAVRSGGGSCDAASAAPSVGPAGARTSAVPLAQLHPGSRKPWTAGPGSALAFFPRSGRPEERLGLQGVGGGGGVGRGKQEVSLLTHCDVSLSETHDVMCLGLRFTFALGLESQLW